MGNAEMIQQRLHWPAKPTNRPSGAVTDCGNEKGLAEAKPLIIWWRIRDSNTGPADYDSVALTG